MEWYSEGTDWNTRQLALAGLLGRGFVWIVARLKIEHSRIESLVDSDGVEEALAGHIAVEIARDIERRHHPGDRTVILVNFLFDIFLLVDGIAPGERLLDRQVDGGIEVEGEALVLRIDERDLARGMLGRVGCAFVEEDDTGIVDPGSQNRLQREASPAEVIVEIFWVEGTRTLKGDFPRPVADIEFRDVSFFGDFDALFVREFGEAPKHATAAGGLTVVEAVAASLLFAVANGEVGLSAQSPKSLLDDGFGLARIFLVGRDRGHGFGRLGGRLRRCRSRSILKLSPRKGARRTHQNQDGEKLFHSLRE